MNESSLKVEQPNWSEADTKRVLLRVTVFFLIFLTSHLVFQWLHPMGAHRFFLNLALGALTAWILVSLLAPRVESSPSGTERQQYLHD
jgi:hypothetical protein